MKLFKERKKDLALSEENSMLSTIQSAALNPDVDVEKMKALLDMQERIIDKNSEAAFNVAMVTVQREMPVIIKQAKNRQTNSRYAKLEHINKVLTPMYTAQGFALMFGTDDSPLEAHVRVTCDTLHEQGHSKHSFYDMPIDDSGIKGTVNKTKPHASASSITYGQRILKCLIFSVQLADDLDGNTEIEPITDEQEATILSLIDEVKADKDKFLKYLKVDDLKHIPSNKYNTA